MSTAACTATWTASPTGSPSYFGAIASQSTGSRRAFARTKASGRSTIAPATTLNSSISGVA